MKPSSLFFIISSFFLISIFPSTSTVAAAAATTTTTTAAEAAHRLLLSFKSSLPDPSLLSDWSTSTPLCSFSFLSCINSSSSSFSLSLSGLNLSLPFSSISTFLLPLPGLLSLSLSRSSLLPSPFPPSPFPCSPSLSSLDLSHNSLPSSLPDLHSIFLSCPGLKYFNFSSNPISTAPSYQPPATHASLSNSTALQVLDLSNCRISGGGIVAWISETVGCGQLSYLSLRGNAASDPGDLDFSGCSNLKFLDISNNNFSATELSFGESGCLSLEHLDISSNRFPGDVGSWVSGCSQLQLLNLSSNRFSGPVQSFPVKALKFLYLDNNGFQGELPSHLADACHGLIELDLSHNNLSGSIPSDFGLCSVLESLDVSNNKFSGELPSAVFAKMTGLRKLNLGFNNFEGKMDDYWSVLTGLETLDLSSNNLSGLIPSGLCMNPRSGLKELFLQNNMFTGSIPPSLSNCSQLVSLDLSFNNLMGEIPSTLGWLPRLQDLMLLMNQLEGTIPEGLAFARSLENLILDFNVLTGEIPPGLQNCTSLNWVSLSNNRLSGEIPGWFGKLSNLAILKLSNNTFYGRIPPELGDSRSLIWLDLNTNYLNGSIPPELFKESGAIEVKINTNKRYAYIKNDGSKACHGAGNLLEFAGIRPEQLERISTRNPCNFTRVYNGLLEPTFKNNGSMIFLDISHNMLSGSIPKEIGSMYYLYILNFGYNNLSGMIPAEVGGLHNLNILDLSNNALEGSIPPALSGCSMLNEINLSGNLLSGLIPQMGQLGTFPASSFLNNTGLCGIPLAKCESDNSLAGESLRQKSNKKQAHIASSIAMGLLFTLLCIFSLVFIALEARKRRKKKKTLNSARDIYIDGRSQSGTADTSWKLTSAHEALGINLATFEKPLRKLTFADLLEATNGFHNDSLIGSGGFGDVYKAQLKDGSIVAIKKLIQVSGQGDREFMAEMETIGKIKHRNLVSLLGYCKVKEERLLVYEYMKYGSLEDAFHDRKNIRIKLNWAARRKIAVGAARGLAFLHHNCIPHIIHRDMKSSNVLLDENLEARVSDFGMARLMSAMDTHLSVSTLAGTPGYVPPEYYQSFRCSTKGDVYSYGVVLLELLTGKRPTDSADFGDNNLVGWVKQHAKRRISDVFDPELMKEDPNLEIELLQHLKVACACLDDRPQKRPNMIQVLAMFKEIHAGYGLDTMSSIVTEDSGLSAVEMSDLTIKEGSEIGDQ
ncbi:hypothetical protein MLD38_035670 [Melastoma candidum]|uniref:Uncharacterized protein n=1 Tax=Melastoma candidum TaxID=119954 RepID=A0ACB9LHJ2_9MYRT|nr:hypothetical protein MLD38_035670 [Melastoma candidum]